MKHFALIYDVVENFAERRLPVREVHLVHLHEAHASGLLQFSGPLGDPPDGALLDPSRGLGGARSKRSRGRIRT